MRKISKLTPKERQKATIERQTKWKSENTKSFIFRFFLKSDADIIVWLQGKENKTDYVRQLIKKDMEGR